IFCQNVAEYGIKSTFFATDFMRTGQVVRLQSHPNERRTQIGHQAESITRAPQHGLAGRRSEDFTSGSASCIGTNMVELRKLTRGDLRHFHHPYHGFAGKPVLQTNGLSEPVSVFGRLLAYQILPNFANLYQKCVAKGVRTGSKRQLTRAFSRAILLKRVKSGGSCQAIIGGGDGVWPPLLGDFDLAFRGVAANGEFLSIPNSKTASYYPVSRIDKKCEFDIATLTRASVSPARHSRRLVLVTVLAAGLASTGLRAQNGAGSLEGSVLDPSGAAIPGVAIELSSPATGFRRVTDSDPNG